MQMICTDSRESQPLVITPDFLQIEQRVKLYATGGLESQPLMVHVPLFLPPPADACGCLCIGLDGTATLAVGDNHAITLDIPPEARAELIGGLMGAASINVLENGQIVIEVKESQLRELQSIETAKTLLDMLPQAAALISIEREASAMIEVDPDARTSLDLQDDCTASLDIGECQENEC